MSKLVFSKQGSFLRTTNGNYIRRISGSQLDRDAEAGYTPVFDLTMEKLMDKAGSDLRSVLGTVMYTIYTEAANPAYNRMIMKVGDEKYDIILSDTGLTINGIAADLSGIPKTVDSILMK